jgi:hypothetical protein
MIGNQDAASNQGCEPGSKALRTAENRGNQGKRGGKNICGENRNIPAAFTAKPFSPETSYYTPIYHGIYYYQWVMGCFTLVATLVDAGSGPLHLILVINGGQSRPHLGSSLQGCGWRSIEPLYTAKVFVRLQANLPMRYLLTRG